MFFVSIDLLEILHTITGIKCLFSKLRFIAIYILHNTNRIGFHNCLATLVSWAPNKII